MALIAPVAFAAAGGLLTGGATWGMAAGWLIGSWLFNKTEDPKNQVFDPGAEEMPSFNQALRGATMPILFGTNRVASNIVWQNAFTTIRKEKKSGGGGGKFKVGQPTSTEVTYEYKWDIMFHIGMSDKQLQLYNAWVGQEKVDSNTVVAIIANSDGDFATFLGLTGGEGVGLNFEDSYFHGAGATGDVIDNWAHFETVTGGGYRFPYTAYVGFKQLDLGNSARVPQISWEVGEGGLSLRADPAFLGSYDELNGLLNADIPTSAQSGNIVRAADNGDLMQIRPSFSAGNQCGQIVNLRTSTFVENISDTEFDSWWEEMGLGERYRTSVLIDPPYITYSLENSMSVIPGTDYVIFLGIGDLAFSTFAYFCVLGTVNSDGSVNKLGYFISRSQTGISQTPGGNILGRLGEQDNDAPIIWDFENEVFSSILWQMPSINEFLAGVDDHTTYGGDNRILSSYLTQAGFTDVVDLHTPYNTHNIIRNVMYNAPFMVPVATIGELGVSWSSRLYWYFPRDTLVENNSQGSGQPFYNSELDTLYGSYPNGVIVSCELTTDGLAPVINPNSYTVRNADFIDVDEASVFPFDDAGKNENDVSEQDNDYNAIPFTYPLTSGAGAGAMLVIFSKNAGPSDDHNIYGTGTFHRLRIFLYNPITNKFTQYASVPGSVCDKVDDLGWSAPTVNQSGSTCWYDDQTSKLYVHSNIDATGETAENFVGEFGTLEISGGTDITPPVIIYRILTSTVFGLGISENDIDSASYGLANQYCEAEDIKVSVQYRREESALAIITQLLELYGGFLIDSGGKIKFGLQEFSSSTVRTIDNNHLRVEQEGETPVLITKGARQDTYNRVKVNYFDRDLSYRQNFIEVADEVDMDLNGVRAQEFPAKFVMSEGTARKMAVRALWGNMYARDIYDFKLGAKDADLEPGDVITLVDSYHSELQSGKQARIVTWQETEPLTFQVKAVEEVEYISTSTLAADDVTEATSNSLMTKAQPLATFGMYELPAEYQGADAQLYVGYRQQSQIMGARLYLSSDGVAYTLSDEVSPYIISGIMADALPLREPGYVEENVEVYLMPDQLSSGSFNPSSPLYAQNHALDDATPAARASGLGNIWINSEMMAFEGVNLVGQNHYRLDKLHRGWGGTHIQGHSSGDTWWKQGGGVFTDTINVDQIGTLLYYKVTGYNFAGQEYDIASVDARTYQIQGTYWRPQVQAPLATYVQSPGSFLTIQSEDLGYIQRKKVVTGGSPVQIEWGQSAQKAGWGAQGYGVGGYGRFTQDTNSVSYRVEVLSADYSTVVRCTTVNTTAFLYTTALNSEDWNGWTGSFAVRVTPFNPYGTALRSRIKILELFE